MAKRTTKVRAGVQRSPSSKAGAVPKSHMRNVVKGAARGARAQRAGKPLKGT